MNVLLRLAACAGFLGLCFVGTHVLFPHVPAAINLDFAEWIRCQRAFDSEAARGEELAQRRRHSVERMRAKERISLDLIAGRLSLAESTRLFSELPYAPAPLWQQLQADYAGASKEECMCRHVIDWACYALKDQPDREGALRRRLEAELRAHLASSTSSIR
jgi:hypothetical protein